MKKIKFYKYDFVGQAKYISGHKEHYEKHRGVTYAILGEVKHAPGHGIFLDVKTGRILPGMLHIDEFIELTGDEL